MAKGRDKYQARLETLNWFGRKLARRSGSACELCAATGVKLAAWEVAPIPDEPDIDKCIFICDTCRTQLENPKRIDPHHWMCLYTSAWSEIPAVQVVSVRMLRSLTAESWTSDLLDQLYMPDEVQAWLEAG